MFNDLLLLQNENVLYSIAGMSYNSHTSTRFVKFKVLKVNLPLTTYCYLLDLKSWQMALIQSNTNMKIPAKTNYFLY